MPVRASSSHTALIANVREGKRPKPLSLPQRMRSWTQAWGAVAGFEAGELPGRGVGRERLELPPVDVGERQLRAGVRPLAADDDAHARRPAGGSEVGQRYRPLHVAARLTRGQRRTYLRLAASWPWAPQLAAAFAALRRIPALAPGG